ncbi:MAG: aminoglycoside phosphotransferase family protein [Actinomycetota bacterium]
MNQKPPFADPSPETRAWIERETGGRVIRIDPAQRSSTSVHHIVIEGPTGAPAEFALRRFTDTSRLGSDPWYAPASEARVLELLRPTSVLAPRLHASDVEGNECDSPALLMEWFTGKVLELRDQIEPALEELALHLVTIHQSVAAPEKSKLPRYQRYYRPAELETPPWSSRPDVWEKVFRIVSAPEPESSSTFIHRDYHVGNTLWSRGRLTGVIDWTTGAWGPPAIDVARMRQNLAYRWGIAAAEMFLLRYEALSHRALEDRIYWELVDCADSLTDVSEPMSQSREHALERFDQFVAGLVDQFS